MSKKLSCGTYLPSTTRHTVNGVDMTRPIGPHSHVQNAAATSKATCEMPVLWLKSSGSMTLTVVSSRPEKRTATRMDCVQVSALATLMVNGNSSEAQVPM